MTVIARVATLVMAAVVAANILLALVPFSASVPPAARSGSPEPSPSAPAVPLRVVEDPGPALSGPLGDRALVVRDVRLVRRGDGVVLEGVAELVGSGPRDTYPWYLFASLPETALVLNRGEWLALRDAQGVGMRRAGEDVRASEVWIPGAPRRFRLAFPVPSPGESEAILQVGWVTGNPAGYRSAGPVIRQVRVRLPGL